VEVLDYVSPAQSEFRQNPIGENMPVGATLVDQGALNHVHLVSGGNGFEQVLTRLRIDGGIGFPTAGPVLALNQNRRGAAAVPHPADRQNVILAIGGEGGVNTAEVMDLDLKTTRTVSAPAGRINAAAAVLKNGQIMLVGGVSQSDTFVIVNPPSLVVRDD
jgi:hypothetical protein